MKNKILLFLVVVLLCSIPIFRTYFQSKGSWMGIVPSFVDDDLYYYARMNNVVNGYPFIGNPYFFEHRNDVSPSFFVTDWVATIPIQLGFSLVLSLIFNFFLWSLVFSFFVYNFFEKNDFFGWRAFLGTITTFLVSYSMILRPVSMQIVAPFLLFLFITFFEWLNNKKTTLQTNILFCLAVVFTFYVYTYLWTFSVFLLFVTLVYFIFKKDYSKIKNLFEIVTGVVFLILPMLYYSYKQITTPFYLETAKRIGLVSTHTPTFLSFVDAGWVFVIVLLWAVSYFWFSEFKNDEKFNSALKFTSITGIGLVLSLFSNVFSGQELEISNHVERFVVIWLPIVSILYVWFLIRNHFLILKIQIYKVAILFLLLLTSFFSVFSFLIKGFNIKSIFQADTISMQEYFEPLDWLKNNTPEGSVVWSNSEIGYYIPILTKDYILFNRLGGLHVMSDSELEERYLVSNYFSNLSLKNIEEDYRQYAGVGNAVHQYKTHNRKVKICNMFMLNKIGFDCGRLEDAISFKGQDYFLDLYNKYEKMVKPNIKNELRKFNVSYMIKDKKENNNFDPKSISGVKLEWQNPRFEIYSFQFK